MKIAVLLVFCAISVAADSTVDIITKTGLRYDGHGALSAGASSRLLYDYAEPYRSDILDYLFKPNFGANLHLVKVEIGGDGQSTDGTEASHMHNRDDLSCDRPYEFWLLEEARKRNPAIVTYVLSWAVPYWVGNQTGYYCQDNIDYHMSWLGCTRNYDIGNIDYIGNWNERAWGPANWTIAFKQAMDDAGWEDTQIIVPDGHYDEDLFKQLESNSELDAAVAGIGLHYPCNVPHPEVQEHGKKYWSSEDYSTVGNWAGAGCWGRLLNQNFVRMNMTSTIAWSLIWSVYPVGFPYFGNGLMYAFEPWSGYYTVNSPIWTSAHTCQFTQVGWTMHTGMNGTLTNGGTYVAYTDPDKIYLTVVLEKLEGDCLRCAGRVAQDETVTLRLTDAQFQKDGTVFQMWSTTETDPFVYQGNVTVSNGAIAVPVKADSVVTVSTWFNGQAMGSATIPPTQPFPKPYQDDFESYPVDGLAKYMADDGGSFQIAKSPDSDPSRGMVLKQWVLQENGVNRWGHNTPPVTYLGDMNWTDTSVAVDVWISPPTIPAPAPGPGPSSNFSAIISQADSQCLDVVGESTSSNGVVDTFPCVSQANEYFSYDSKTGFIVGQQSKLCLSTRCSQSAICQQTCNEEASTQWTWTLPSGSIALRSNTSQCLTVTISTEADHTLSLTPCVAGQSNQQWSRSAALPNENLAGVCARASFSRPQLGGTRTGYCLQVDTAGKWYVNENVVVHTGTFGGGPSEWHRLNITVTDSLVSASIDDKVVYSGAPASGAPSAGMVVLQSTYQYVYFDNFQLQ
eukprot:m.162775 g.162775  ORF g.162775 m.162775 type:complete len:791 (-) comp16539_c0_seq8:740-3112(-)